MNSHTYLYALVPFIVFKKLNDNNDLLFANFLKNLRSEKTKLG